MLENHRKVSIKLNHYFCLTYHKRDEEKIEGENKKKRDRQTESEREREREREREIP